MEKNFLTLANKFYECHKKNKVKMANIYAKRMNVILLNIIDKGLHTSFCDNILLSKNFIAIIWVCGLCIDCDYRREYAINVLKELCSSTDEIVSRDANMLLFVKTKM